MPTAGEPIVGIIQSVVYWYDGDTLIVGVLGAGVSGSTSIQALTRCDLRPDRQRSRDTVAPCAS